jgi:WD40 repeat protein/transcriptional regulator with XRE-family HTH domain
MRKMGKQSATVKPDGKKCRIARKKRGLTQEGVEHLHGPSRRTIDKIEKSQPVLIATLRAYAEVVDVTYQELLLVDEQPTKGRWPEGLARHVCCFDAFIEDRVKDFTGREFAFDALDKFLENRDVPSGYFLITGKPGVGKSALVAMLVRRRPSIVRIHHFNIAMEGRNTQRQLLGNLCARLIREFHLPYDSLPDDFDKGSSALTLLLGKAATNLKEKDKLVIVVDALDELERSDSAGLANPLFLPARLPKGVYFVLTARSEHDVPIQAWHVESLELAPDSQENREDIRALVSRYAARTRIKSWMEERGLSRTRFVDLMWEKSEGDFMYLHHVLPAMERGRFHEGNVDELPHGLRAYYRCHWAQMQRQDMGTFDQIHQPVVCVLAAAREALAVRQIAEWTRLDPLQVNRVLREWMAFLHVERSQRNENRYRLYHEVFQEFLQEEIDPGLQKYHVAIADSALQKTSTVREESAAVNPYRGLDDYELRCLPDHLAKAGQHRTLGKILLDFEWLQAKLEIGGVAALIADYEYLPDESDVRHVDAALRLSAHVLERDRHQLASQLYGRLRGIKSAGTQALCDQFRERAKRPWFRTLAASLTAPGGSLLRMLKGHTQGIYGVAVSGDGHLVVSASGDGTVRVWDLSSGIEKMCFCGHRDSVNRVAFADQVDLVVSAADDGTMRVWNLETAKEIRCLECHTTNIDGLAVTPDGRLAVTSLFDGTVQVWDLNDGVELYTLDETECEGTSVAVTCDGRRAISTSSAHAPKLWDLDSGTLVRTRFAFGGRVKAVAFTRDGRQAILRSIDCKLIAWDLESGKVARVAWGKTGSAAHVAVTPDARWAVTVSVDGTFRKWDLGNVQETQRVPTDCQNVSALGVTPDGRCAITAYYFDHTLKVWDLQGGSDAWASVCHDSGVDRVRISHDGRHAVTAALHRAPKVWNLATGTLEHTLSGHFGALTAVNILPDGCRAASVYDDNTVTVSSLETGAELKSLNGPGHWGSPTAITPSGDRAVFCDEDSSKVWDLRTGEELHSFGNMGSRIDVATCTPEGRSVILGHENGRVLLRGLEVSGESRMLGSHNGGILALAVTPDGRRVISAGRDDVLKVWDVRRAAEVHTLVGHKELIWDVVIAPNGSCVVSGSEDRTVKVWDMKSGKCIRTLEGHGARVVAVIVSADGRRVYSFSGDHTLKAWALETGRLLATFTGESGFRSGAVAPDGLTVVVGEESGRVHILRLEEDGGAVVPR